MIVVPAWGLRVTATPSPGGSTTRLGVHYSPTTVGTWANRGLITTHGYSTAGHARYDLAEVLAHVVTSQALRDAHNATMVLA